MNTYHAFYKGKTVLVAALTSYDAQKKAADQFKARESWKITVVLAAKHDGEAVVHKPQDILP